MAYILIHKIDGISKILIISIHILIQDITFFTRHSFFLVHGIYFKFDFYNYNIVMFKAFRSALQAQEV